MEFVCGSGHNLDCYWGMFSFAFGAGFVHFHFYRGAGPKGGTEEFRFGVYNVPYSIVAICTFTTLILAIMNAKELYELSLQLGNQSGVINMIKTLRYPLERGEITFSRWVSYRNLVAMIFPHLFSSFLLII